ncbi:MAG: hypothetical protein IKB18_05565, partial [Tidjanibacter sp.]|nr:hypothetical protein [Tidjanibacter sp.]
SQFSIRMTYDNHNQTITLTIEELAEALRTALGQVRVYVLESDITAAQQAVRTVVQQATLVE